MPGAGLGSRPLLTALLVLATMAWWSPAVPAAVGTSDTEPPAGPNRVRVDGSRLGGFVLPILPIDHDLEIDARSAERRAAHVMHE